MVSNSKSFSTAAARWEGVGPYYAMFPVKFANAVINEHTSVGDAVLDPFAGRGTAVFSAASTGRIGLGIEISPVGWIYAKTKLCPSTLELVEERLKEVAASSYRFTDKAEELPFFFHMCFSPHVRRFLLAARSILNWRRSDCDRTLMAIILVYLHGKKGQALSNQMRQTKAMSPKYAVDWWTERGMAPPDLDPISFLQQRIRWRYAKGTISSSNSRVYLGNSIGILPKIDQSMQKTDCAKAKLVLTSPPYFKVTNYHYDQWLRLWMLGFEAEAYVPRGRYKGRFTNAEHYRKMLMDVFQRSAKLVADDSTIYVRTGKESFTRQSTVDALISAFPNKKLLERAEPFQKPTQTHLFGDKMPKEGEVDLVMRPA